MKKTFHLIAWIIAGLVFHTCNQEKKVTTPALLTPEKANEVRQALIAWMECEECEDNELTNLIKHKESVTSTLIQILASGPSPAKREEYEFQLSSTYDSLYAYNESRNQSKLAISDKKEYVKTFLDNYVALYQTRAAIALARFDSPEAKKALEAALSDTAVRQDVKNAIRRELKR